MTKDQFNKLAAYVKVINSIETDGTLISLLHTPLYFSHKDRLYFRSLHVLLDESPIVTTKTAL